MLAKDRFLTAVEFGQLRVVPELVFLNCCHLGRTDASWNLLAASVAQQLIDMACTPWWPRAGPSTTRLVRTLASDLYRTMLAERGEFGEAVLHAPVHPEKHRDVKPGAPSSVTVCHVHAGWPSSPNWCRQYWRGAGFACGSERGRALAGSHRYSVADRGRRPHGGMGKRGSAAARLVAGAFSGPPSIGSHAAFLCRGRCAAAAPQTGTDLRADHTGQATILLGMCPPDSGHAGWRRGPHCPSVRGRTCLSRRAMPRGWRAGSLTGRHVGRRRRAMGQNGRQYYETNFDRTRLFDQLETWLENAIQERKHSK